MAEEVEKEQESQTEQQNKQIQDVPVRKFKREGEVWKHVEESSAVMVQALEQEYTDTGESANEGWQELKKVYTNTDVILGTFGAVAVCHLLNEKAREQAEAAVAVEMLLSTLKNRRAGTEANATAGLAISDLSISEKELAGKLKENGLSKKQQKNIIRNKDGIKEMLMAKELLLGFSRDTGKLSEESLSFVDSGHFFYSYLHEKEFDRAVSEYFAGSADELLRKQNPAGMSDREIKKLLRQDARDIEKGLKGFSVEDKKMLEALYHKKKTEKEYLVTKGHKKYVRVVMEAGKLFASRTEDAFFEGVRSMCYGIDNTRTALAVARFTLKTGGHLVTATGRVLFLNPVSRRLEQKVFDGLKVIKNVAVTKTKETVFYQKAEQKVKTIKQEERIKQLQERKNQIVKENKARKQKKAVKKQRRKEAAGKMRNFLTKPFDVLLAPLNLINQLSDTLVKQVLLPVAAVVLVFVLLYMLLIALSGLMMGIIAGTKTNIMLKPEQVRELVTELEDKTEDSIADGMSEIEDSPISDRVYNNVPLYCYGSPKSAGDRTGAYYHHNVERDESLMNGIHVYYLDTAGNVLSDTTSNVKDVMSAAATMMYNSSDDPQEYRNLFSDMWEGMKPVVTLIESDIYHTVYSTDTYPFDGGVYYCNDRTFYRNYNQAEEDGVCMYDSPVSSNFTTEQERGYMCSGSGCEYEIWSDRKLNCTEEHTHGRGCYRTVYYKEYYCPGHEALHCSYGYRDLNVYITIPLKEDLYKAELTEDSCRMQCKIPIDYNATVFEDRTLQFDFRMHWNGYKRNMKRFFEEGAWDYEHHLLYAVVDLVTGLLMCEALETGDTEQEHCIGNVEWCDMLYSSDWKELYGVTLQNDTE